MATSIQKLNGEANRSEVVRMRLSGATHDEVAEKLGITEAGSRYHQRAWLESIQPPEERAHEMRETVGARLERMHQVQWPFVLEGDVKATELALRIQAQFAKLYGLELQPGINVNIVVTAEGMAQALGLDPAGVIDVEAVEEAPDES